MTKLRFLIAVFVVISLNFFSFSSFAVTYKKVDISTCPVHKDTFKIILQEVKNKNPDALSSLSDCLRYNHKIIFQACIIDTAQLQYTPENIRGDENFVFRLLKIHPEIIKYTTPELRKNKAFLERAIYVNRDSLQYADEKILNNILFMQEMIEADSRNYMYAAERIKAMYKPAATAFEDNGLLLKYAPSSIKSNKALVKIAVNSNVAALEYADKWLQNDKDLKKLVGTKPPVLNKILLEKFLRKNYVTEFEKRNIGKILDQKKSIYAKDQRLINHKYITKWQTLLYFNHHGLNEDILLIPIEDRNVPNKWKADLKERPELVQKIEKFLRNREIDQYTIDNLYLSYLWKIKDEPETYALHLYLLRENSDDELGNKYVNVTSLSVIAQKDAQNEWRLSVVEVIFDSEILTGVEYENGHKQYILQDLYFQKNAKNPWLLYLVQDKFEEYFEIYEEQKGGKYQMIYRIDPVAKATKNK